MTEREIDPLLLCASLGYWYVIAVDHKSGEERTFRVDRIRDAVPTSDVFTPPPGFDPSRYTDGPFFTPSSRDLLVTLDLDPEAAWIREVPGGRYRIELRTPHLAWLVRLLLSAGEAAHVVEPPELQTAVREAAVRALALYEP
jgi:proteasome accessory factor C